MSHPEDRGFVVRYFLGNVKNGLRTGLYNERMPLAATCSELCDLRETVLDNGLKVLVQQVHTAPIASVWCWYRVGSKNEVPGLTGVSHWVEHMNFKGTRNIPREQMTAMIERFGGSWNGYTWVDHTTYLATATSDALERMLFLEAERMADCLYEPDECEAERTVIISELQGGENDPDQLLDIEVTATAFKAHPYRHPTIGWLSDLRAMSRDDLYAYYRRHYVPNNATLVIVGDVDADEAFEEANRRFRHIPAADTPARLRTVEPPQLGERRVTIADEGTTGYMKVAFHAPAVHDPDFFPMLVLDAVLTGAKGLNLWASFRGAPPQRKARLYTALVDRRLASAVSGALLPTQDPFLYTISVTALEGAPFEKIEERTLAELDRIRKNGVTPAELERAKRQLCARSIFDADSVTNIAHQIGFFDTVATVDLYRSLNRKIAAITADEVGSAARKYLKASNRTVGWFRPI
jgi:zinc protease